MSWRKRFCLIGAGAALAIACGQAETTAPPATAPIFADMHVVATRAVAGELVAAGAVHAAARVELATRMAGQVTEVAVREGDAVRADQVLARVDSRDVEAAVARARAGQDEARAALVLAESEAQRAAALFAEAAISPRDHDRAIAARDRARATVDAASRGVAAAEAQRTYGELRAPFAGVVVARLVDEGDLSTPGLPLLTVERRDSVRVTVSVSESVATGLTVGERVSVEVGGTRIGGTLRSVVPAQGPAARSFEVDVWLAGDVGPQPGHFARVYFSGNRREALLVPVAALVQHGQLQGVYVVADGRAVLRWIRTGTRFGDDVEVLSGLDAGDTLAIARPGRPLRDGAAVTGG